MSIFKGCATALITPFTKDGVDFVGFKKLIDFQLSENIDALVVCGTTGEPATMTESERLSVIRFAVEYVDKRVPVIVGTGSNCTAKAVSYSKEAEDLGADALLVVTPYYNKCTQKGLIAHYSTIANAVKLPIICYNVPGRTGVNILPATFAELAKLPNIAAIKEASGNMEQITQTARLSSDDADMISGDDGIVVPVMSVGGTGVISVVSNIAPKLMRQMTAAYLNGDTAAAAQLQLELLPLVKAMFCEVNPIPVKYAASLLGLCQNILRLPLTPAEAQSENLIADTMRNLGLI